MNFLLLQTMEAAWKNGAYIQLDAANRTQLRESLLKWLRECPVRQDPTYIRNKMAQIFVVIFELEYPVDWPTFFSDITQYFDQGEAVVDMFVRILDTIDSMIVDRDVVRNDQQLQLCTQLKDAMREHSLASIVESWMQILTAFETTNENVVSSCLETIAKYISWIDIRYTVDQRFIEMLFRFINNVNLREHACECLVGLVEKGMDPMAKLELIRSLSLIQLTAQVCAFVIVVVVVVVGGGDVVVVLWVFCCLVVVFIAIHAEILPDLACSSL